MDLQEYQTILEGLSYGKRLPTAVYIYRGEGTKLPLPLEQLVGATAERCQVGPEFTVLKFRTDELKLSFLSYPTFLSEAHPALAQAITVDLVAGKTRRTDYAHNLNPPILHRKESFLPPDHPLRLFCE